MNIGNITSDNFNLDGNGKDIQIEVYEQLIEKLQQENKQLKDNWNKLKKQLEEELTEGRSIENQWLMGCYDQIKEILNKMQELERGKEVFNEALNKVI